MTHARLDQPRRGREPLFMNLGTSDFSGCSRTSASVLYVAAVRPGTSTTTPWCPAAMALPHHHLQAATPSTDAITNFRSRMSTCAQVTTTMRQIPHSLHVANANITAPSGPVCSHMPPALHRHSHPDHRMAAACTNVEPLFTIVVRGPWP